MLFADCVNVYMSLLNLSAKKLLQHTMAAEAFNLFFRKEVISCDVCDLTKDIPKEICAKEITIYDGFLLGKLNLKPKNHGFNHNQFATLK